jgi:hypothetical protein
VLTEISTVTDANNLVVSTTKLFTPVTVDISVSTGSSELNLNHLQLMLTIQQLKSTTPNHRHRPNTIKLLAPVTDDISVEEPVLTEISTVTGANNLIVLRL